MGVGVSGFAVRDPDCAVLIRRHAQRTALDEVALLCINRFA